MESLKVLSTEITKTLDLALFEVEKGEDSLELVERLLENIDLGINTRLSIKPSPNYNYLIILMVSERDNNKSSPLREILKEVGVTLLLPK